MGKSLNLWGFILLTILCILIWGPLIAFCKYWLFNYTRDEIRDHLY